MRHLKIIFLIYRLKRNIITSFKFESTFNVVANLVGMYNSRLLTYDPFTMRVGEEQSTMKEHTHMKDTGSKATDITTRQKFYDFDYLQRFNQFFTCIFGSANPIITKNILRMKSQKPVTNI